MSETTVYRQRWASCDTCESTIIVQRDDSRGVPDEQEWAEFPDCPVCGDSLGSCWNGDEQTERTAGLRQGIARAEEAEARVAAVVKVHGEYFDLDRDPFDDASPEPEDVWRFDRDFRAALTTDQQVSHCWAPGRPGWCGEPETCEATPATDPEEDE